MGAKRKSRQKQASFNNIVNINTYQNTNQVNILPRNKNQENYLLKLLDSEKHIVFGIGPAGTGKTLLAVQVAIKLFKQRQVDKIIITRPAVSVDEDLGFLPGTLEQKMAPWVMPIMSTLKEYFNSKEIEGMMAEGVLEIAPLAYMRGRTFSRSFIIADEMQLSTPNQMKMLLTRIGDNSKLAVTGDLEQADRRSDNGLMEFLNLSEGLKSQRISFVKFKASDIVRHPVVAEILKIYNN